MSERRRKPTDFELDALKVLWDRGPSTAREVHEALRPRRSVGYTTVLKILQLMEEKEMVAVDRSQRSHVYSPRLRRSSTLKNLVRDFVDRAFDGASSEALVHLVESSRGLKGAELDRIEELIAELRDKEKRK